MLRRPRRAADGCPQALADAEATAALLGHYLDDLDQTGALDLADLGTSTPASAVPNLNHFPLMAPLHRRSASARTIHASVPVRTATVGGDLLALAATHIAGEGEATLDEIRELELSAALEN